MGHDAVLRVMGDYYVRPNVPNHVRELLYDLAGGKKDIVVFSIRSIERNAIPLPLY